VRSTGLALLTFEDCDIEANLGYGLQISDAAEVTIKNCRIADNSSVGLYLRDSHAVVDDSVFQWNEWDGIMLEGTATMECDEVTLSGNGRWGLSMLDASQANFVDSVLDTQALGNISIDDSASLELEASRLRGGMESSIEAHGDSRLRLVNTQIMEASGDGLRLRENADLHLERSVVAQCRGSGLSLKTEGDCQLLRVTVAYNGGHGLEFCGKSIAATHSIFALNGGIGLSVSASSGASQSMQFEYNNVWGNQTGNYAGINRSPLDISVAPEFANPESGDFSLSTFSPCIGAGEFGLTMGANGNPLWSEGVQLRLGFTRTETNWGAVEAAVRWDASAMSTVDGYLFWDYEWEFGRAEASSSLKGFSRLRTQGSFMYSPPDEFWTVWPPDGKRGATWSSSGIAPRCGSQACMKDQPGSQDRTSSWLLKPSPYPGVRRTSHSPICLWDGKMT